MTHGNVGISELVRTGIDWPRGFEFCQSLDLVNCVFQSIVVGLFPWFGNWMVPNLSINRFSPHHLEISKASDLQKQGVRNGELCLRPSPSSRRDYEGRPVRCSILHASLGRAHRPSSIALLASVAPLGAFGIVDGGKTPQAQ